MTTEPHPLVSLVGRIGGITIAMVALVVIFGPDDGQWVILPIIAGMVLLGLGLGYLASKKK